MRQISFTTERLKCLAEINRIRLTYSPNRLYVLRALLHPITIAIDYEIGLQIMARNLNFDLFIMKEIKGLK